MDLQSKTAYRQRITQLCAALEDAEARNDLGVVELREELERIATRPSVHAWVEHVRERKHACQLDGHGPRLRTPRGDCTTSSFYTDHVE